MDVKPLPEVVVDGVDHGVQQAEGQYAVSRDQGQEGLPVPAETHGGL